MDAHFTQYTGSVNEAYGPLHADVSYAAMVIAFGEPNSYDDPDKVDVAWDLECEDGKVHIYNYKNGPAYNNGRGRIEDIGTFSIQGENSGAVGRALIAANSAKLDLDGATITIRAAVPADIEDITAFGVKVQRYLPSNYALASIDQAGAIVRGRDAAGWTATEYVIPRLASGGIVAAIVDEEDA